MKKILLLFVLLWVIGNAEAQVVFQNTSTSVYEFLDEMATMQYIDLNTAAKPYSRRLIAEKLSEVNANAEGLNHRQKKELAFYLKDFNKELMPDKNFDKRKDLYYFKDSLFTFTINPILGLKVQNNSNGNAMHRWNGAEAWAYAGKKLGFYASLRDNGVSDILAEYNYLTPDQGGNYKYNQDGEEDGRSDYSEMKGGITYAWDWGSVGLIKDNFTWGNNYNGANIFSARNPSFSYINLQMKPAKWFDFHFVHGWLVSEELDSSRTYLIGNGRRQVFWDKYLAANLFTFTPIDKISISLGNSVVYGDGLKLQYLIPVMFYKSVDHTYNGTGSNELGQNSQMFFDLSIRKLKKLHFYTTVFLDELSISNMWDKDKHSNLYSAKFGTRVYNLLPNTTFTWEYTRTNPWAYQHEIPVTQFTSNEFNLGHYLQDNAEEIHLGFSYRPIAKLVGEFSYTRAYKGTEVDYQIINGVPNVFGLKWLEEVRWASTTIRAKARYEIINDGFVFAEIMLRDVEGEESYTPAFYQGSTTTIAAGLNIGF